MNVKIEPSWKERLQQEFDKEYFEKLTTFVRSEYQRRDIEGVYPPGSLIFNAFNLCPFDKVKVVIIGQDPYHGPGQAHGLCFSVNDGVKFPPSLQNIFKEIRDDIGTDIPASGNLTRWAEQGVLLLNATLTVRAHEAGSHQGKGWETFTDSVIRLLNEQKEHLVFILWGSYAQRKGAIVDRSRHLVLSSAHPSPLSAYAGFFGNHHFSLTNGYLGERGLQPIHWLRLKVRQTMSHRRRPNPLVFPHKLSFVHAGALRQPTLHTRPASGTQVLSLLSAEMKSGFKIHKAFLHLFTVRRQISLNMSHFCLTRPLCKNPF